VPLLLTILAAQSVFGESVELILNGSFTNGLAGWEPRGEIHLGYDGVYRGEYGGVALWGTSRLPASIAQTIDRPELSFDLVFSYHISTVFLLSHGCPYLEVRVIAYVFSEAIMQDEAVTLYSKKYVEAIPQPRNTYSATVNLKDAYKGDVSKPPRRIRVVFETWFEETSSMAEIRSVAYGYVHRVGLLMTPSPPPTVTMTLTVTTTETEALTLTQTVKQRIQVVPIEFAFAILMVFGVTIVLALGAYAYSRRRKETERS